MSILDGTIWSRCSIVMTCPARPHFQRTLSKERWGQGWDERYRLSREEEKQREKERQEKGRRKEKEKTRQPILKKLCAALLRSFSGSIAKK